MKELLDRKYLGHLVYLSATAFYLVHMLRLSFYLGTSVSSVAEIIQKADHVDISEAESASKSQVKIFAYNNLGKFEIVLRNFISSKFPDRNFKFLKSMYDFFTCIRITFWVNTKIYWRENTRPHWVSKQILECKTRLKNLLFQHKLIPHNVHFLSAFFPWSQLR